MVGVAYGRKRHPAGARPHGHAQSVARGFRGRGGVTHHKTFSLQHDGLGVVLAADPGRPPEDQEQQPNGDRVVGEEGGGWTRHSSGERRVLGVASQARMLVVVTYSANNALHPKRPGAPSLRSTARGAERGIRWRYDGSLPMRAEILSRGGQRG